jgi:hypothetical protein
VAAKPCGVRFSGTTIRLALQSHQPALCRVLRRQSLGCATCVAIEKCADASACVPDHRRLLPAPPHSCARH